MKHLRILLLLLVLSFSMGAFAQGGAESQARRDSGSPGANHACSHQQPFRAGGPASQPV